MNIDAVIQLINDYGLPTALTIFFIFLYKQQNEKNTKMLLKMIKESKEREESLEEQKSLSKVLSIKIDALILKIDALKKVIIDLNNKIDKGQ